MSDLTTLYDPKLLDKAMKIATAMATLDRRHCQEMWPRDRRG